MSPREPHLFRCAGSTLRGNLVTSRPLASDLLVKLGAVALGYSPRHVPRRLPYTAVEVSGSTPSDLGSSLAIDRKSTRLNSSHVKISYAVFCLKKKKRTKMQFSTNQQH